MSGAAVGASAVAETRLATTISPGNSGSAFGYRTTAGPFGSLASTSWAQKTITDVYSDAGNNLIVTFNSAPTASTLREVRGTNSVGSSFSAPTSLATIVGNSFVWASSLGGNIYTSGTGTLAISFIR